jgi:hypothetical protein
VVDKIEKGKRAMKLDVITRNDAGDLVTDANTHVAILLSGFRATRGDKNKKRLVIDLSF